MKFRLEEFYDNESGIAQTSLCVGTTNTTCDVIPFLVVESKTCIIPHGNELRDGYVYFIQAKASELKMYIIYIELLII